MAAVDKWGFNDWAVSYDEDVHDETYEGNWIFEHYESVLDKVVEYCELSKNSYSTVLDIGIGTGNLVGRFLEKGLNVIGIDPSEEMRKICTLKIPEIRVLEGDFLNIPQEVGSVDIVVSSFAFHHLNQRQKETSIIEMKKVLKPKGRIVMADPMFRNMSEERKIKQSLIKSGEQSAVEVIENEYFSFVDDLETAFTRENFSFNSEQLTQFVWICKAVLTS